MLEVRDLHAGYGSARVLKGVSLSVGACKFVGVLGPNGAGKSTLLRSISGLVQIYGGDIQLEGISISSLTPEQIVDLGVIHVPQGRMLFPELTVEDNLQMGAYRSAARQEFQRSRDLVEVYFPVLKERRDQLAGVLSGGEQQMLAIGRAMMAKPRLMVLDEPSLGLAPILIDQIFEVLRGIYEEGTTVLVAEQNASKILNAAQDVYVLESGRIAVAGSAEELKTSEKIERSYLGVV